MVSFSLQILFFMPAPMHNITPEYFPSMQLLPNCGQNEVTTGYPINGKNHRGISLKLFSLVCFCWCIIVVTAQDKKKTDLQSHTAEKMQGTSFPQSFIGHWKGKLQWMVAGKPARQFTMQLLVQPADSAGQFTWQIIYGDSAKDNRSYILKAIDSVLGHWVIDERNGILLDGYVHGNSFHGAFTVQGNTIVDNYRVEKDQLHVEFYSIKLDDKKKSGKGTAETPFVDSYKISSYQMGTLFRVK